MAGKNEVKLTFAGDSDQLEKSFAKVGEAADAAAREVDDASKRIGSSSVDTARSFDRAAQATDDLGQKGGDLESGFRGITDSMSGFAQIAQGDVMGGLTDLSGGVEALATGFSGVLLPALKAARDNISMAADAVANFVTTTRGMLISLGAVGIAIGAAVLVYQAFNRTSDETVEVNQELADTLDDVTGAVTEDTRAWVINRLEQEGVLAVAPKLGISYRMLTDSILGNADAQAELDARMNELLTSTDKGGMSNREYNESVNVIRDNVPGLSEELEVTQASWERTTEAIEGNTAVILHQIDTLQELSDLLKAQSDPIFAFVDAQNQVREAQAAVNEAVDEFGRDSSQHERALLDLAEAEIGLFDATGAAADAVGGSLIPALEQMVEDGQLSRGAFRQLEEAIEAAEDAANEADGTVVRITAEYTTVYEQIGQAPIMGRAVPTFASGGLHSGGLAIVGEEGAELLDLPAGTRIYSHGETMAMAAGGGWDGGSAPQPTRTILEVHSGGSRFDDALVEVLAHAVRARGGDVQVVLGRG